MCILTHSYSYIPINYSDSPKGCRFFCNLLNMENRLLVAMKSRHTENLKSQGYFGRDDIATYGTLGCGRYEIATYGTEGHWLLLTGCSFLFFYFLVTLNQSASSHPRSVFPSGSTLMSPIFAPIHFPSFILNSSPAALYFFPSRL